MKRALFIVACAAFSPMIILGFFAQMSFGCFQYGVLLAMSFARGSRSKS